VIERSLILCDKELLAEHLPFDFSNSNPGENSFDLAEVEKHHIKKVLRHTNKNKTEAARLMNIGLTTLYRKIQEYKLEE
jgi:transcriptional regulator with PAS, ATPase and Fis domain